MGVTKAHKIQSVIEVSVVTAIPVFYVVHRNWNGEARGLCAEMCEAVATEARKERKRASHFPSACRYTGRGVLARGSIADEALARRRR